MTNSIDGGWAFPQLELSSWGQIGANGGMSLREYYAGQALTGILANSGQFGSGGGEAEAAVMFADSLIAELQKGEGK